MGAGMYRVRVVGELDSSGIIRELDRISKSYRLAIGGNTSGRNGVRSGIGILGKDAGSATKNLKGFNVTAANTRRGLADIEKVSGKVNGKSFRGMGTTIVDNTQKFKGFGRETLNVTKKVIQFGAVTAVIRGVTSGLGDMVQNVFELDAALTEFKKVSDLTGRGLEKYTDQAYKAGRETARTGTEMIEAATQFRKMGYSDQQAMTLATTATMFQNIADAEISAGDAALFINSQLKAFNFTADDSMHVIDSVNEVANNFAVGTNDLQLALSKTASAMGGFGNSFEQTIGIITAGTEIMVGQPSKVARGWRTIGANITKLAKETDVYKDASGKVEIQMRKSDGTMKNTYEFLTDLHKSWGDLNKEQQTAIALQMGGKNQMEVFMATMNNFDTAIEATNTAMGAQGSAAKENGKYLESMAGHLANLKSAWEEFSYKVVNSDLLKKGIDVLANALHFLSSDFGQVIMWGTLAVTTLNLIAKAALGAKELSLVKLVTSLTGVAGEARLAEGAIGNTIIKSSKLDKIFSILISDAASWAIGIAGAAAAISAGLILYDKWLTKNDKVIQQEKEAAKATKDWHKAQKDVQETKDKIRQKQSQINELEEKRKNGELSQAEEQNLDILELELQTEKEILELQKKREARAWKKQEQTIGKKGLSAEDFITMGREGWTAQETWENLYGVSTKAGKALVEYQHNARDARIAQDELDAATEHLNNVRKTQGHTEEDLAKAETAVEEAQGKVEKAQESRTTSLQKMLEKKKEYDDYLKEGNTLTEDELKDYKRVNKVIEDNAALHNTSKKATDKDMKAIVEYGKAMGVISKDGQKINQIKLGKFTESMLNAGHSVEDVQTYLEKIKETNPDATITLNGANVAEEDLGAILQYLEAVDSNDPSATVVIGGVEYATSDLQIVDGKLKDIDGKTVTAKINVDDSGAQGKTDQYKGDKKTGTRTVKFKADTKGVKNANNTWKGDKTIGTRTVKFKAVKTGDWSAGGGGGHHRASGVRHFASGGSMENAEVNEYGFEIIRDARTGLMRVVNGGKRGLTMLNKGDSVFTHNKSIRMLREVGLTEGDVIYGSGHNDIPLFGIRKPKGYKKGKNQKAYDNKYNAIVNAMNDGIATLEYQRSYYNWTASQFNQEYSKLYNQQYSALNALNNSKTAKKKGVKKQYSLGVDIDRAYNLALREALSEQTKKDIESLISNSQGDDSDLTKMLNAINAASNAQLISSDEAKEYRMQAYKQYVDYNLKQFQNDKKTYAASLALIKDYYAQGKLSGEDYYKYLDDLANDQLSKEKKRLSEQSEKLTNTYDLAKAYVQRQIDLLTEENEEQDEQNQLVELQNNLAKARNQRVRVYKEGEGFVYERDTEAIREATQALQDYAGVVTDSQTATNPILKQWEDVLKLFDDIEADNALRRLEILVGSDVGTLFGGMGTDTNAWANWIKNNLSTTGGIQDVLNTLDKLVDTNDIINYLDNNGQVRDAVLQTAVVNNILPQTYAAAITQATQGMSTIANTGELLATQKTIAELTSGSIVSGSVTQNGNIYNFDSLVLPNVTNAQDFVSALDALPNMALQASTQRG